MPPKTVVPIDCRLAAPAPLANISGRTPRMKAKAVIRIGRRRSRPASIAAATMLEALLAPPPGEFDDQDRVLGGEADQHDEADLRIDVDRQAAQPQRRQRAKQRQGRRERTMNGMVQLSYCAARMTKTKTIASAKTIVAIEPAFSS